MVLISNTLNKPIENIVYKYYMNKAKKKLNSLNNLDVIGITGSYGKTSSKNILNDILSVEGILSDPSSIDSSQHTNYQQFNMVFHYALDTQPTQWSYINCIYIILFCTL